MSRYSFDKWPISYLVAATGKWALAQCRGTICLGARKYVMVQDFDCMQMRVSRFSSYYEFVLVPGAKAKTVTSFLIILSVLVW